MLKATRIYAAVVTLALFAAACGGGSHGNGGGGGVLPAVTKLFLGTEGSATLPRRDKLRAQAPDPTGMSGYAFAQAPTPLVAVDQSFTAKCDTTPSNTQFVMPETGTGNSNCASQWNSVAVTGEVVLGNGTLEYLIAQGINGTSATAGKVTVSIMRGGVEITTLPQSCTVGTGTLCEVSLGSFAVQDKDLIVFRGENGNDTIQNLRAKVVKKLT